MSSERVSTKDDILVSVIVPTKDVVRTIRRCLFSVRAQDYGNIEIILVDNGSTDGTFEIAKELADVAVCGGPERSAQRNQAIALSSGEYVLWIDADMVLAPDVVSSAVDAARDVGAVAVFVPEISTGEGYWTACRALERRCYVGSTLIEAPRLVRRDFFERSGAFHPGISGQEDADLRMRLLRSHERLASCPAVIEHLEGRLTLRGVLGKRRYYGRSLPAYAAAQPGAMRRQALATVVALARHWPILLADPVHAVGILFLRSLEVLAYSAGALAQVAPRTGRHT